MAKLDSHLTHLAIQAISEPEKWDRVLGHILATTDAKAAIVTLREKESCQIINDVSLEKRYHSPLIQGFPPEAVLYYLNELRTIDPWAEAQKTHYPHVPMLMSKVCPVDSVEDTRFFDWLAQANMSDTVVFALDRVPGYWTACNLFLEGNDSAEGERLLEYANAHFDLLRNAWKASQTLVRCQQSGQAAFEQLAKFDIPACVTDDNGQVLRTNSEFQTLVEDGVAKTSGPLKRLSLCRNILWIDDQNGYSDRIAFHGYVDEPADVAVAPFEPEPLFKDKRERLWLLTFGRRGEPQSAGVQFAFDLQKLNDQETVFFECLRKGADVIAAGEEVGVARTRAFEIWASIRKKLNVKSIHQVQG